MKIIGILLITILAFEFVNAQKFELYSGLVLSNSIQQEDYYHRDDITYLGKWKPFPMVGYRLNYIFNQRWNGGFGFEFLQLGAKELYPYNDSLIFTGEELTNDLILHNVKIPVFLNWKSNDWLRIECGYSLNYSFRKNQTFLHQLSNSIGDELVSYYKPFTHLIHFGAVVEVRNISFRVLYNNSLTGYYSSPKYFNLLLGDSDFRRRMAKLYYFTFTLGYTFKELNKY